MKIDELQRSAQLRQLAEASGQTGPQPSSGQTFSDILAGKMAKSGSAGAVKFSAHAVERLASRNISLTEHDLTRLNQAVGKMAEKGGKDSLMIMDNLSFVVSVENRTVITALQNQTEVKNKVFTNIDSAMLI